MTIKKYFQFNLVNRKRNKIVNLVIFCDMENIDKNDFKNQISVYKTEGIVGLSLWVNENLKE